MYVQFRKNNMDEVVECLPNTIAAVTSVVKLVNIHLNRENFKKMYDLVTREWELLRLNDAELHVLEDITTQGSKFAQLYKKTLLVCMIVFLMVPLLCPFLDIVLPLNETRPRQQLFRVNYIIFNHENYFFYVYFQLAWATIVLTMTIIIVDSLYMIIIHHASGLFAVCSYQVRKATEYKKPFSNSAITENNTYELFKQCLTTHDKAIQFYEIVNDSSQNSYLIQVGLSMIGISLTAVQTVLNLDKPEEALRYGMLLGAEQFHLFVMSLPGQTLLDHCIELKNDIYCSTWYKVPAKFQRVIYTMQIRCLKSCVLSAGGLYEMNMENFGTTFKTCISYFTMVMSLRE
ncbi:hypothetical protein ANTPLA_LOCUS8294 [Anthophora plagiata]